MSFRFTTWLSKEEMTALEECAEEAGTSKNFIVRIALRAFLLGKPVPQYLQREKVEK